MLLGTLEASFLGNMLAGKGVVRGNEETIRAGKGKIRAGEEQLEHNKIFNTISSFD